MKNKGRVQTVYNSIFVSHSSQNAWLLDGLLSLIREVVPEAEIFCSSEAVIPAGGNYKEVIYSKLADADMFIAVVSDEYWKSKYSIMELGAAYQRYCFDTIFKFISECSYKKQR